ncbi:elongation factor 4 [bacterium]|nr:MAG: elongation factor 4 [bacterium]
MDQIRNFCIIAHIDHGKSTLADRILEITGSVTEREMKDKERVLDTLELEQERGITIKLQSARMNYKNHVLNLIDTPGHVDFSYEVSRSLAACEGCLLLVDATQGIQAQTLSVFYAAMEQDLKIIPVINKIDLPSAQVEETKDEIVHTLGFSRDEILCCSGKTGAGVTEILDQIIERIPSPSKKNVIESNRNNEVFRALVFDSFFHEHKGAIALVRIFSGKIQKNDKVKFLGTDTEVTPIEIGYITPSFFASSELRNGEVGYIATGLKDLKKIHTGDTVTSYSYADTNKSLATQNSTEESKLKLPGYQPAKSMVFASLFPVDADEFLTFSESLEKLAMNDAALNYQKITSPALGSGFLCGYLGLLHMEITQERLEREFNLNLITTVPSVEYKIKLKNINYDENIENVIQKSVQMLKGLGTTDDFDDNGYYILKSVTKFPDIAYIDQVLEPYSKLEIITPEEYIGPIMQLCSEKRAEYKSTEYLSTTGSKKYVQVKYEVPSNEIITDFFDRLKSVSQGYASMDYNFFEFRVSDIVKVDILVNHEASEPLSFLSHRTSADARGRRLVEKLKDLIPRQQFPIPIQAAIGMKIVARETIPQYRKDVLAGMSGGHVERKKKLLQAQKKGKERLKTFGSVEVPKEAFLAALRN